MKIIVPTDFSANADHALRYAQLLARMFNCPMILFHVITPDLVLLGHTQARATEQLNAMVNKTNREFAAVAQGDLTTELAALAQPNDLVVMGTKGATGLRKILMGSNTVRCLEVLNAPMIVVPIWAEIEWPRLIIHLADLKEVPNDNALDVLKALATASHAEVRLVHFSKGDKLHFGEVMEKRREQHGLEPEVKVSFRLIEAPDPIDGLAYYLDHKPEANMVSMVKRTHKGLSWLATDHVKELAYHTRIPVLAMPEGKFEG